MAWKFVYDLGYEGLYLMWCMGSLDCKLGWEAEGYWEVIQIEVRLHVDYAYVIY